MLRHRARFEGGTGGYHVCTLRDRRIVVMGTFPDRAAALEAAGLRG
jgi:hypothetical protein